MDTLRCPLIILALIFVCKKKAFKGMFFDFKWKDKPVAAFLLMALMIFECVIGYFDMTCSLSEDIQDCLEFVSMFLFCSMFLYLLFSLNGLTIYSPNGDSKKIITWKKNPRTMKIIFVVLFSLMLLSLYYFVKHIVVLLC